MATISSEYRAITASRLADAADDGSIGTPAAA